MAAAGYELALRRAPKQVRICHLTSMIGSRSRLLSSVAVAAAVMGLVAGAVGRVQAASLDIGAGVRISLPLKSWKELRDEKLVIQRFDYSCGSAALAILMSYG